MNNWNILQQVYQNHHLCPENHNAAIFCSCSSENFEIIACLTKNDVRSDTCSGRIPKKHT